MKFFKLNGNKYFSFKVLFPLFFTICLAFESMAQVLPVKYSLKPEDVTISGNGYITACSYDFAITDIVIPNNISWDKIRGIDSNVFAEKGITSIEFPEGLEFIDPRAFYKNSITGTLILPSSLIFIGEDAFRDNKISSVTFEENSKIELINRNVFSENPQLSSITLPNRSVEEIEFVEYRDSNGNKYQPGNPITDFKLFYSAYVTPYILTATDVEVTPDGVITSLRDDFSKKSILIPSKIGEIEIKEIGAYTFQRKGLTHVQFTDGLIKIGEFAFYGNSMIGSLILPPSITTLGEYAFGSNFFDGTLTLPINIAKIGNAAFFGNSFSGALTLPSHLRTIGSVALFDNYFSSITFEQPSFIEFIGPGVFSNNPLLSPVTFPSRPKEDTEFVEYTDIEGNSYRPGSPIAKFEVFYIAHQGAYTITDSDVEISPDGVITECHCQFNRLNIIIPDKLHGIPVKGIGDFVFLDQSIIGLTLPEGLETIGEGAFSSNYIFGTLSIPSSVKTIGHVAFNLNGIDAINFKANSNISKIGGSAFFGNSLPFITLPDRTKDGYRFYWLSSNQENLGASPSVDSESGYSYTAEYAKQLKLSLEEPVGGDVVLYPPPNDDLGHYDINTEITINAIPNEGYTFTKWDIDGMDIYDISYLIAPTISDINAQVFFAEKQLTNPVTLEVKVEGKGIVTPGKGISRYSSGDMVELIAEASSGYRFDKWIVDGKAFNNTENPMITLSSNTLATAYFIKQVTVTFGDASPDDIKYLSFAPSGGKYDIGTEITLSATQPPNLRFDKWVIGDKTYSNIEQKILLSEDIVVTASFIDLVTLTVIAVPTDGGAIKVSPATDGYVYDAASLVKLEAMPAEGYIFRGWVVGRKNYSNGSQILLFEDVTATATFIKKENLMKQVTLSLKLSPEGTGNIIVIPPPNEGIGTYDIGTEVTILGTTSPEGYRFDKFLLGQTQIINKGQKVTLEKDTTVTAYYIKQVSLSLKSSPNGIGSISVIPLPNEGIGTYDIGTEVTILGATSPEGYRFDKFLLGETQVINKGQKVTLEKDTTVTAYYIKQVSLSLKSSPEGIGSVSVTPLPNEWIGTYDIGTEVTILGATSPEGYRFDKFVLGQTQVINKGQKVTLERDTTVTAYYIKQVILSLKSSPEGKGSLSVTPLPNEGINTYDINTEVTITATTSDGYQFEKWVVETDTYSENVRKIVLVVNTTATANFTPVLALADAEKNLNSHFPNPVSDRLTVNTEGVKSVVLLSIDGRMFQESLPHGFETLQIDVSTLPTGVYLIQLTHDDGSIVINKLVKQ